MSNRVRTKTHNVVRVIDAQYQGGPWFNTWRNEITFDSVMVDSNPGPGSCRHDKPKSYASGMVWFHGYTPFGYAQRAFHYGDCFSFTSGASRVHSRVERQMSSLNWDKLPTSSKFDLLAILAELDDTLAVFSKKFWEKLSYGSVSWGLLPIVQDFFAVRDAIAKASTYLGDVPYEDTGELEIPDQPDDGSGAVIHKVTGTYHNSGTIKYPGGNDILAMFDRLGFHPSLSTAWDLVPMSFLVD